MYVYDNITFHGFTAQRREYEDNHIRSINCTHNGTYIFPMKMTHINTLSTNTFLLTEKFLHPGKKWNAQNIARQKKKNGTEK